MRSTHAAHKEADDAHREHPADELARVCQHGAENLGRARRIEPVERARAHLHHVRQHPAAHRGVEHHENQASDEAPPAEPMPAPRRLQGVEGQGGGLLAGTTHRELHHHDRQAQNHKEQQVEQDERRTAVLAGDVGEAPDVAQADGATCRNENEAQARREPLATGLRRSLLHGRRGGSFSGRHIYVAFRRVRERSVPPPRACFFDCAIVAQAPPAKSDVAAGIH